MITLKRLKAENFKALSSIDLTFPTQGSVLIEGYNEAGKSTLFEAVYVALYGRPLVGEDGVARQEEVIQHGQSRAVVELHFNVGQQELSITRVFERRKQQQAMLTIQHPGAQQEIVNRVRAVEERILKELGNLDGDNLRNSCFVEQKELGRIEALSLAQRSQAIQKLLGLEKLTQLVEQFKFKRDQERELDIADRYLKLARLQAEVSATSDQEVVLAERLDAVRVVHQLRQLADLEVQGKEAEERLSTCAFHVQEAREYLKQWETLKEQIALCSQATSLITEVRHTHKELSSAEEELAHLERIEQGELPAAQLRQQEVHMAAEKITLVEQARKQVSDAEEAVREASRSQEALEQAEIEQQRMEEGLSLAQERVAQRQTEAEAERQRRTQKLQELDARKIYLERLLSLVRVWETEDGTLQTLQQEIDTVKAKEQELFRQQRDIQRQETEAYELGTSLAGAEREMQAAADRARLATGCEALTTWIRLKGIEDALSTYPTRQQEFVTMRQEAEKTLAAAQLKTRLPLFGGIILAVLTLLALVLGILWHPALILAVFTGCGALISWIAFSRTLKAVSLHGDQLTRCKTEIQQLEMQHQAVIQASGDPAMLGQYEQQLQLAGMSVPENLDAGRALHEKLHQELGDIPGSYVLQEAAQKTRDNYTRVSEQLKQARTALDENKAALDLVQQSNDPTEQLRVLQMNVAKQEKNVTVAEQKARASLLEDIEWPTSSGAIQTLLSKCQSDIHATGEAQEQQGRVAARLIQEAETDKARAEEALQRAREITTVRRAADPAGKLAGAQENLAEAQAVCRQRIEALQPLLQRLQLNMETDVEPERGRIKEQVNGLQQQLDSRPSKQEERNRRQVAFIEAVTAASNSIENLLTTAHHLVVVALPSLPSLPHLPDDSSVFHTYIQTLTTTLNEIEEVFQASVTALDEPGTRQRLDSILGEQGTIEHRKTMLEENRQKSQQAIDTILSSRDIPVVPVYTYESIHQRWSLTVSVLLDEENQVTEALENKQKHLYALRRQEQQMATELHYPGTPLNIDECLQKVTQLTEERQICEQATRLLKETHDRIARRVLPITERNMQPLLQQLTGGRYRDVRLTPDESNGQQGEMDYRIRVWDPTAGRFVAKNLFSGGTRDQCSLALRLAFALATLPQELGVAPGFIFLDEPLSAFDAPRARALVELLTSGTIAQQFSQVVLISHYHAFDRDAFHYHVRMDNGQIVESNLPDPEESDSELPQFQAIPTGKQ